MSGLSLIDRAQQFAPRTALTVGNQTYTYSDLLAASSQVAAALLAGQADLHEARVAFMVPNGLEYVAVQWGIWRAGGVAVPLSSAAAVPEIEYALQDADVSVVVVPQSLSSKFAATLAPLGRRLLTLETALSATASTLPQVAANRRAMILYTSGTTSKPKGVVTTHQTIAAQIESLVTAWAWQPDDCLPLFLPLHHIHGIINILSCALWSGATVDVFPRFDSAPILQQVAVQKYTLFMAVPTIYVKLIEALQAADDETKARYVSGFSSMRLMVSGSAALPAQIHETWTRLTGQKLLERYGMTEIGMALSNPLHGERRPGAVGVPLPGVEVRLMGEEGQVITAEDTPGEIQVRGPGVFQEYWNKPQITADSFQDGWFQTGDMAVLERGYFRILGRMSVDIIKSGGYKLSALEIEASLCEHPLILECAVVGLADETWGETVAAAVVLQPGTTLDCDTLRDWARERLSPYKLPKRLLVLSSLPRNALGKVTKPAVSALFDEKNETQEY